MNEGHAPVKLQALRDDIGVRITYKAAGPVPTISVDVGDHIIVEVDPTDITTPVSLEVWDLGEADTDLRDLMGSTTVNQLWSLPVGTPTRLEFISTRVWEGIAALATQIWNERWNVFPLDPALMVIDKLVAASSAGPFGAKTAREQLQVAIPVLTNLQARHDQGQLTLAAAPLVEKAIESARTAIPLASLPPVEESNISLTTLLESRISDSYKPASNAGIVGLESEGGPVQSLMETPDWRLTGLGMLSTAEGTAIAEYVNGRTDRIKICVSTQDRITANNRADEPYYQGIITDAANGEMLAFVHMGLNPEGTKFEGIGNLARPLQNIDILDIRHPYVNEPVQTDLSLRQLDKIRRTAARAYAAERLMSVIGVKSSESLELLEKAWLQVAQETSILQRDFKVLGNNVGEWINIANAYRRRALAASPDDWVRQGMFDISTEGLPDLDSYQVLQPTLGELGFTGRLYAEKTEELQ